MSKLSWLCTALAALAACGESGPCGEGWEQRITDGNVEYCVYAQATPVVVEGGFRCPPGFPARRKLGGATVCGEDVQAIEPSAFQLCRDLALDCVHDRPAGVDTDAGVGLAGADAEADFDLHAGPQRDPACEPKSACVDVSECLSETCLVPSVVSLKFDSVLYPGPHGSRKPGVLLAANGGDTSGGMELFFLDSVGVIESKYRGAEHGRVGRYVFPNPFQYHHPFPTANTRVFASAFEDVSGDDVRDLVTSGECDGRPWYITYLGLEEGPFLLPWVEQGNWECGATIRQPQLRDLDGDGALDLVAVTGETATTLRAFRGSGDGRFDLDPFLTDALGQSDVPPTFTDLNGDGHVDYAFLFEPVPFEGAFHADGGALLSRVHVALGDGAGVFRSTAEVRFGVGTSMFAFEDMDADGHLDLLAMSEAAGPEGPAWGVLQFAPGLGDGTFGAVVTVATIKRLPGMRRSFATGDLNRDGMPDVVVANAGNELNARVLVHGQLHVLLGRGDGTLWSDGEAISSYPVERVFVGDLTGDGTPEVLTVPRRFGRADNLRITIVSVK